MADQPFTLDRRSGSPLLELPQNRQDPEPTLDRVLPTPAPRSYTVDAWVYPALGAGDPVLDRLAGVSGSVRFESSDRYQNQGRYRASSAFDGQAGTAWVARWAPPSAAPPWIAWTTPRPQRISRLRLIAAPAPVRRPTVVQIAWPGGHSARLPVAADGTVRVPHAVSTRSVRLTILAAETPSSVSAVGIGGIVGPGIPSVRVPRSGRLHGICGDAQIQMAGRPVALQPRGTVADLDAGRPMRASACGGPVPMGAGTQSVRSLSAPFSVDLLRLSSPAPAVPATGGGTVVDPGRLGNDALAGARVALTGPSWLVLGESFSKGWTATCNGRSLGPPRPIDGYANGWPAPAGCRAVAFSFAPQRTAVTAYLLAAVACVLLCVLLLAVRPWRRARYSPGPLLPAADPEGSMPLLRAGAFAAVATLPLCLLFALRTSLFIFPALTFALARGVSTRRLAIAAAGLLGVVVPIAYAVASPKNLGGYNFDYSIRAIGAHWVGVLALVLLMVACGRALLAARRAARSRR
jgi:hypothetical protein